MAYMVYVYEKPHTHIHIPYTGSSHMRVVFYCLVEIYVCSIHLSLVFFIVFLLFFTAICCEYPASLDLSPGVCVRHVLWRPRPWRGLLCSLVRPSGCALCAPCEEPLLPVGWVRASWHSHAYPLRADPCD